jgi:antitoxin HicB
VSALERIPYPFTVRPLSEDEGSGYLVEFPDLPGCISDGKTPEEAIANGRDALKSYLLTAREFKQGVPKPTCLVAEGLGRRASRRRGR